MKMIRLTPLVLVLAALLSYAQQAAAQIEIGVKVSPSVNFSRTFAKDQYNFKSEGAGAGIGIGIIGDYFFGANYAFSSGLIYNSKGGKISYDYNPYVAADPNDPAIPAPIKGKDDINLQYLEIPLTLKLFTNELSAGTRLYFQGGLSLNTLLASKVNDKKIDNNTGDRYNKRFNTFEIGAILSAGIEWPLGQSTKFMGGLTYHRGLTDVDNGHYSGILGDKKIEFKNNTIALDFGLKF
ncbi:PorT family protein [Rufibacter immobilis]|uniref:PorT family protein n=1 Tax=Rufibacter immobilis TaxID=1348778 RepID=A0A3M9N491_9BACT|nr:porin family protein [Rufibacter immobilis]RNI32621.1 PorT family protein [Rufibacter immobilis]